MDLVLKLREIRRLRGLSQKDVARLSGVGEKTISSFETGQRIGSLKLEQLKRLLGVYGLTEADFFGSSVERQIAPWELDEDECAAQKLVERGRADILGADQSKPGEPLAVGKARGGFGRRAHPFDPIRLSEPLRSRLMLG